MRFLKVGLIGVSAVLMAAVVLAGELSPSHIAKSDIEGIRNFSRIDGTSGFGGSTVGFGGATEPSAMPLLKRDGFATVINLRLSDETEATVAASRTAARAAGLNYIHLPFDPKAFDASVVDDFLDAVGTEANQPVYVHCNSASRAAGLWMIGRVLVDGWDIDAASTEARVIAEKPDEAIAVATSYIDSQRE